MIAIASQAVRFTGNFAFQILLARLVSPSDFGVVAMVAPFVALIGIFTDFGLTQATLQLPHIDQEKVSSIFWINVTLGALVSFGFALTAPVIAGFYRESRVVPAVLGLAGWLFVGTLYSQHIALLTRRLEFGKLATIDIVSAVTGWVSALGFALRGGGFGSIIVNQGVSSMTALVMSYVLIRWRPSLKIKLAEAGPLLRFGGNMTGANLADLVTGSINNVAIGRMYGGEILGLFDRAARLLLIPATQVIAPVTKVAVPLLSRTSGEEEAYRRAATLLTISTAVILTPMLLTAIFFADVLIPWLLGSRWSGSVPYFQTLGASALFLPFSALANWTLVSQGRTAELRNWALGRASLSVALCPVAAYAAGPIAAAASLAVISSGSTLIQLSQTTKRGPMGSSWFSRHLRALILPMALAAAGDALLRVTLGSLFLGLFIGTGLAYPMYVGSLCLSREGRDSMRDLSSQAHRLLSSMHWGRAAAPQ